METQRATTFVRGNDEAEGRIRSHRTHLLIQETRERKGLFHEIFWAAFQDVFANMDVIRKTLVSRCVGKVMPTSVLPREYNAVLGAIDFPIGDPSKSRLEFLTMDPAFRNQASHSSVQSHTPTFYCLRKRVSPQPAS